MKNNRSLAVSTMLSQELRNGGILSFMGDYIPEEIFETKTSAKSRDRVFSHRNTLETMLLSSTLEDKSLKNAVTQFYIVHQKKREILEQILEQQAEKQNRFEGTSKEV